MSNIREHSYGEGDRHKFEEAANYWQQINAARADLDVQTWDGLFIEFANTIAAEVDPLLRKQYIGDLIDLCTEAEDAIDALLESDENPYEDYDETEDLGFDDEEVAGE